MDSLSYYKYIFVVLVYKNTDVLRDFFLSINKIESTKVVVVDSYFDDQSRAICKDIAQSNNADFIAIPNKGYSYGNNMGIEFVRSHYKFSFIIISNSDIIVNSLSNIEQYENIPCILAPETKLLNGKRQNPNIPKFNKLFLWMLDKSYSEDNRLLLTCAHLYTRFSRELYLLYTKIIKKERYPIFCCHGSFFIMSNTAVRKLGTVFDESMYLYNEELYLAFNALTNDVRIYFIPSLKVTHLEGASSGSVTGKGFALNKESFSRVKEIYRNFFFT